MSILAVLEQRARRVEPHVVRDAGGRAADRRGTEHARRAPPCSARASTLSPRNLPRKQLEKVYAVEHELLKDYTPDGYSAALRQLIEQVKPALVLFPHTYQVRDFLPKLATALGTVAVSDVVGASRRKRRS